MQSEWTGLLRFSLADGTNYQSSVRHHQAGTPTAVASLLGGRWWMRDWVDDWRRWSAAERILAVVLGLLLIGLPFAVWL